MNALLTAEVSARAKELEKFLDIVSAGWMKDEVILSEDEMVELVKSKDFAIIITSYDPITKRVIDSAPNLKLIVCTRANPVNVDVEYATKKGIKVSYAPGRNSTCTAEYTVALMLSITRKIPMAYAALKQGEHTSDIPMEKNTSDGLRRDITWALGADTPYVLYKGYQLSGKVLGVVGYGSIGRRVADLCRAFGMEIMAYDPFLIERELEGVTLTDTLSELAEKSDIMTIHCKDTPETYHLINKSVFNSMKESSYLINTSRGVLVDEQALIEALRTHEIAGAAVDVFDVEPIAMDHPFITELDNVVITPHLAGATYDAIENHTEQMLIDINHFVHNEPLEYQYVIH